MYKTKADTGHFFSTHLVRSDMRRHRHLPGLNTLANRNPRTRGNSILRRLYIRPSDVQRLSSPASDVADDGKVPRARDRIDASPGIAGQIGGELVGEGAQSEGARADRAGRDARARGHACRDVPHRRPRRPTSRYVVLPSHRRSIQSARGRSTRTNTMRSRCRATGRIS